MKCIIAGSRTISNMRLLLDAIRESGFRQDITEVVSGGEFNGVDRLGEIWASDNHIPCTRLLANWERFGRAAGPIRNQGMADYVAPDGVLIAVWDGKSKGTRSMVKIAKAKGLKVFVKIVNTNGAH